MSKTKTGKIRIRDLLRENAVRLLVACLLILAAIALLMISGHLAGVLTEQQMAQRWSREGNVAQVSCFFSADAKITKDRLEEFEHTLDAYLTENSIEQQSANPGARLWVSAYSAEGKISLSSDRTTLEADALGIGGDFFLFHPQRLLYGSYFSGNDLNQDYCVIDQDAAWQLFGSNDVAGMMVYISGIPHIVTGVIERPKGRLVEAAGLDSTRVYVSHKTLEAYGTSHGINHYEIVMPNPVKQFAYKYIKEQLGSDEKETEVLENTSRFRLLNRLKVAAGFGIRSMNGRAIIYPYWENLARGYEDITAFLTLAAFLLLIYPTMTVVMFFVQWWRHKGWTFRDIWIKIKDRVERLQEQKYQRKQEKKKQKRATGKEEFEKGEKK